MNRHFLKLIVILCITGLGSQSVTHADYLTAQADTAVTAEVLVFVDVSGSMKINDPHNMRAPAIRMLSGMAPDNARVGIYLFGTTVRELVPFARVNEQWKQRAEQASKQYRSRDMYTNIEAALSTAESVWSQDTDLKRSVILLTDGIVDIDKDPSVSEQSRNHILGPVLESLKQQQTNVHTIALSQNADHELLQALAMFTDGKNHQVDNAELLQRTFMSLFELSAPQDTIPLTGNEFTVDNSISELTLLVFRKPNAQPTQIKTPSGILYSLSTTHEGLKWKHDTGYDLISIQNPEAGAWQLIADVDPDNRAMVVTDLKMLADELPATMLNGEEVEFKVWLEEEGEIITRPDFLKLISANVVTQLANGEQYIKPLNAPEQDGVIYHTFGPEWKAGESELVIKIDGETFMREKRFPITIFETPISVKWEELAAAELQEHAKKTMPKNILNPEENYEAEQGWIIHVDAMTDLIDMNQSELSVVITTQTGNTKQLDAEQTDKGWIVKYLPDEAGKNTAAITLNTRSPSGRDIVIEEDTFELGEFVDVTPVASEVSVVNIPSIKKVILPVVVGNILFAMLFMIWKIFKRMRESAYIHPEEVL